MSVKVMSLVFDAIGLTPTEKLVMLSYADHAAEDGTRVYPSNARTAAKTGLTIRSVQRATNELIKKGLLERVKFGVGHSANEHVINISELKNMQNRGDSLSSRDTVTPQGCHSVTPGVTESHVRHDTVSPLTIIEPSLETSKESSEEGEISPHVKRTAAADLPVILSEAVGMVVIPSSELARTEQILSLVDYYGREKVVDALRNAGQRWTSTKAASGRPYRITNMGWVDWAQEDLMAEARTARKPRKQMIQLPDGTVQEVTV